MTERSTRYPMWMRHPNYRPAVISDDYAQHGSQSRTPLGYTAPPGKAAQLTPVLVHDEDTEAYYAAKGYEPSSAQGAVPPPPLPTKSNGPQYPKWVDTPDGRKIVKSAEEEARVTAPPPPPEPSEAEREFWAALSAAEGPEVSAAPAQGDERSSLLAQLEAAGIEVDRRWGVARLREALEGGRHAA